MQDINWTPTSLPYLELVVGSMVTFLCDEDDRRNNRKKNAEVEFIEWFVNGRRITPSWFDWRVSVSSDGRLGIWPIGIDDSGQFECLANGQLRASVTVNVIPVSSILISGLLNYLFVCGIFAVATISMGCLLGNRNQEKKMIEVDRMEEFLAESVFQTDKMAKNKIAGIIEKQGLVDERQLIENKAKSNRSTIMILLKKPMLQNPERENRPKDNRLNNPRPISTDDNTEGTTTTVTNGTTNLSTSGTNQTTNATGTTTMESGTINESATKTNETETGTTITKTEEDDGNMNGGENESDEDDNDDVASGTTSKGSSTGKIKPTKRAKKGGKNTKKTKGKGKTKNTKNKETGKKKPGGTKEKAQKTKNTKKKAPSKPTNKKK
ncbi:hypothetical protein CAEBREN_22575 [Caenorhabditis brenneri]|uniref:Ig-like domain-containing protein n=1 Tax=Caenorhabditis brenneri TaxID=135651 RepID=G0P6Z0_CAEBE|nr:hypothetical protein CAEBREN_22575 [Caenorhabditis brenneri]